MTEPDDGTAAANGRDVPRLSMLIPSWNAASTIERALASILEADGIALECIVIDDGSTDGTADIVQAVADADPRVVLLRLPENQGVSNARNRGLEVARGEWLGFLDADDRLLPGAIRALMAPTAEPDVRAVIGQRIWTDGQRTWQTSVYDNPDIREPGRKSIATNPGLLYYASATGKVLHRSLVDGLQFEGRVLGDQAWTIRALLRAGDGIEVIDTLVYEWSRPPQEGSVATITAATRASASGALAMVAMAPVVFRDVSAEVDTRIDDEPTRLAIKRAYFDRLVRSDLSSPVKEAIERHDPATGRLYTAVGAFLETVPAPILAASDLLVANLLRPPVRRWSELVPAGRSGYWRMIQPVFLADRHLVRRMAWHGVEAPAFLVARLRPPLGTGIASAWLAAYSLGSRLGSRLRRGAGRA